MTFETLLLMSLTCSLCHCEVICNPLQIDAICRYVILNMIWNKTKTIIYTFFLCKVHQQLKQSENDTVLRYIFFHCVYTLEIWKTRFSITVNFVNCPQKIQRVDKLVQLLTQKLFTEIIFEDFGVVGRLPEKTFSVTE